MIFNDSILSKDIVSRSVSKNYGRRGTLRVGQF